MSAKSIVRIYSKYKDRGKKFQELSLLMIYTLKVIYF